MVNLDQQWLQQARRTTFEAYRQRQSSVWIGPRGASMRPLIGADTWMLVEFGASEITTGDIILFPLGDIIAAHRVVAQLIRQGQLVLESKGDAEPYRDPFIAPADVLGVVRALRRGKQGPSSTVGCAGASAHAIAAISRLHGQLAALLRHIAAMLPDPLRRVALRAIPPFTRVAARIILTPFPWAAALNRSRLKMRRG